MRRWMLSVILGKGCCLGFEFPPWMRYSRTISGVSTIASANRSHRVPTQTSSATSSSGIGNTRSASARVMATVPPDRLPRGFRGMTIPSKRGSSENVTSRLNEATRSASLSLRECARTSSEDGVSRSSPARSTIVSPLDAVNASLKLPTLPRLRPRSTNRTLGSRSE